MPRSHSPPSGNLNAAYKKLFVPSAAATSETIGQETAAATSDTIGQETAAATSETIGQETAAATSETIGQETAAATSETIEQETKVICVPLSNPHSCFFYSGAGCAGGQTCSRRKAQQESRKFGC